MRQKTAKSATSGHSGLYSNSANKPSFQNLIQIFERCSGYEITVQKVSGGSDFQLITGKYLCSSKSCGNHGGCYSVAIIKHFGMFACPTALESTSILSNVMGKHDTVDFIFQNVGNVPAEIDHECSWIFIDGHGLNGAFFTLV